jgi:putative superfamily III holin-X
MADRTEGNGSHPVVVTDSTWPQLLAETVDEVARIVRTEIRLGEAGLRRMFENQAERMMGALFLLVALVYGSMFVLGSVVLLIHQWLAWWMAFGITGMVVIVAGFGFQTIMARRRVALRRQLAVAVSSVGGAPGKPSLRAADPEE